MDTRCRPRSVLLALLLLSAVAWPAAAHADEGAEDPASTDTAEPATGATDDDAPPPLTQVEDAEAKAFVKALKSAARRKKAADVMPALDAIESLVHPDFVEPLVKLAGHDNSRVAQKAADLLVWRATEDDVKLLWRKLWKHKENRRRYAVRSRLLRVLGRLGIALDDKEFDEVEKEWRWIIGNPHPAHAPALADMCWYFGKTRDKRMALRLAHELDQPAPENVSAENNPPASWWEKRVRMWQGMVKAAAAALKEITGQDFATRDQAKAWFQANEDAFGVEWKDWI